MTYATTTAYSDTCTSSTLSASTSNSSATQTILPLGGRPSPRQPNLNGLCPYDLVFGRKPRVLIDLGTYPNVKVSATYKDFYELLNKKLEYLQRSLFDFKMKKLSKLNRRGVSLNLSQKT